MEITYSRAVTLAGSSCVFLGLLRYLLFTRHSGTRHSPADKLEQPIPIPADTPGGDIMAPAPSPSKIVYLLPLTDDGAPDVPKGYVYLPAPIEPAYTLRFVIQGTSRICRHGSLWENSVALGETYDRARFREHKLEPNFNQNIEIDIPITCAGAFEFYVTYRKLPDFSVEKETTTEMVRSPTHHFNVAPKLSLNGQQLPLNSLSIISTISKFMGTYPKDWNDHLRGMGLRGYNMVHFTPLMKRGDSNSPYSIFDQMVFDDKVFKNGEKDVAQMMLRMEKEYGLLGLTDVVWNHTANNSKWLEEHPEAGYSPETAPWLQSAFELDTALLDYSKKLKTLKLPTCLKSEDDLHQVIAGIKQHVLPSLKLWQFYAIDAKTARHEILVLWKAGNAAKPPGGQPLNPDEVQHWSIKQKADYLREHGMRKIPYLMDRHSRVIIPEVAAALLTALHGSYTPVSDMPVIEDHLTRILDDVNLPYFDEYDNDVNEIMEQLFGRIKYLRLDDHGPKLGPITEQNPLIESYFTRLPLNATTQRHNPKALALVNNGWVWNADAMKDHAGPESKAYLLRQVISWGDCVKLRYGQTPDDNPYLWGHMAKYTRLMAKYFHAFRIDNCHSTPLAVAEYLLDEARRVRPNIAVFAELFTGGEDTDYVFAKRLGLNALIREAMQCWDTQELSRLVHRHGGIPIGSFDPNLPRDDIRRRGRDENIKHIQHQVLTALFMDCTHDNEPPAQKRTAQDTLANAALVGICSTAIGSVMGYDEIYPEYVNLVSETRSYNSPYSGMSKPPKAVGEGGIGGVKRLINELHTRMAIEGYDEMYLHHEGEYITVHRVHPVTRRGYLLIAHTAFPGCSDGQVLTPVHLIGSKVQLLGAWELEVDDSQAAKETVRRTKGKLVGLPSKTLDLPGIEIREDGVDSYVHTPSKFPPGAVALLETWIPVEQHSDDLVQQMVSAADQAFAEADLVDLNFALYKCEEEERDWTDGQSGTYVVPGLGPLVYGGLQGWWSVLDPIIKHNDLGHPLCDHLRQGLWPFDYIASRLESAVANNGLTRLQPAAQWFRVRCDAMRDVPSFLRPRYFAMMVQSAYYAAWKRAISNFSPNIQQANEFFRELAMVSVQQVGHVKSASLWPNKHVPSMAAGLPHFATDWTRCWGRDVMISLRGLLLATGRFDLAREHLLAFGSVLKHGMIPNLLSAGRNPRYNARDSVWFFLQVLQDYTKIVPDGIKLLDEPVPRRFLPYNDEWFPVDDKRAYSQSSTFAEIIQEILQRHASGISFREHDAGPNLDRQMRDEGFQIDIRVDWSTGMIFGGNQWNCGTWQDKMGESEKAGSKGYPGTPRDGAAVEITGMLYSALKWVATLHEQQLYPHAGVKTADGKDVTFQQWARLLKDNFERCYWVPQNPEDDHAFDVDSQIINRRGIYKDLYRSSQPYEDYQLRANFPIAMVTAPDLFTPKKALFALHVADRHIRGPTGMATLDPSDYNYRPCYNNSEDSTDFATAKGRNYHQGPEWLWPTGFFLRALLKFGLASRTTPEERVEMYQQITQRLAGCQQAIRDSPWRGLAELTNKDGAFCPDSVSCVVLASGRRPAQAPDPSDWKMLTWLPTSALLKHGLRAAS
ncbi:hypothetical protein KEM52_001875 [Ascosphaera acerosa]|nr:hypothetical protein KEM52_001875 [Ascosphaera acerosa]